MIVALVAIIVSTLLIPLGAITIADRVEWKGAGRLLDWTRSALVGQWRIGCVINFIGGVMAIMCGIDLLRSHLWIAMIVLGPWLIWRGFVAWPAEDEARSVVAWSREPHVRS